MDIKVQITFSMWPYEQTMGVTITPEEFKNMDKYVDSITSNLKMALLSHVRANHPTIWYKYSPFQTDKLNELQTEHVAN